MHTPTIKLHAYLAQVGISSRRKAEQMIIDGLIRVNGQPAHVGQRINLNTVQIEVDGKQLQSADDLVYFLVYKPAGYLSTVSDELGRKTVMKLLPREATRVYPVGRLDKESEGLLLLTNDGELAFRLTHPKFEVSKTYQVLLKGIPSTLALNHLKRGVKLTEGYVKPQSFRILGHESQQKTWLEITIKEGKNQQVRRMMARIGYDVERLIRVQMGSLELSPDATMTRRPLSVEEVATLRHSVGLAE